MPSKSKAQRNFMAAAAHNPAFAKKAGIPTSVAKEFNQADKGKKFGKGGETMKHADVKMDKKMAKKAVGMHEEQLHGGKKSDMSKLKKGGKVKCMADGGSVEEREKQKKMYDAAEKMDKEPYSPMDTMKRMLTPKKDTAKPAPKKYARGGGIEVRGKTRGKMC
jgi:hypothetical protein